MTLKWKRAKKTEKTNKRNRAIWLVYRTVTNARGFWLAKRILGWKKLQARELSRNQSILHFDVILQHDWPIEQCLLHIRVFFGGKTKSPCFDLFIHWLIKQITNRRTETFFQGHTKIALSSKVKGCTIQIFSNLALNCQPYKGHSKTAIKRCGHHARFLPVCP